MGRGLVSVWRLGIMVVMLMAACARRPDEAMLVGRYQLVNGPDIRLGISRDGAGEISSGEETVKIHWSLERGQVFLDLPSKFLSQLETLGLSERQKDQGGVNGAQGYFGLTPDCRVLTGCRLQIDLDGYIYFEKVD